MSSTEKKKSEDRVVLIEQCYLDDFETFLVEDFETEDLGNLSPEIKVQLVFVLYRNRPKVYEAAKERAVDYLIDAIQSCEDLRFCKFLDAQETGTVVSDVIRDTLESSPDKLVKHL